jgi:hypothetical protein
MPKRTATTDRARRKAVITGPEAGAEPLAFG